MLRDGRAAGLLLLSICALLLLNATAPLNPPVRVLRTPAAPVSSECEEGLAPQPVPRINVAEVPPPVSKTAMQAPPSSTLRGVLREAQDAAAAADRDAFNAAIERAKAMLQTYPAGGERNAANDVLRVYADLDRLWTYEFDTPSGAFFDASTGLLQMLNAYPGYQKAVADQTVTVGGEKLYPSRESRDFLVREAASRLSKLGVGKPVPLPVIATTKPAVRRTTEEADASKPLPPIVRKTAHASHRKSSKPKTSPAPAPVKTAMKVTPIPKPIVPKTASPKPTIQKMPPPVVASTKPAPKPVPVPAPVTPPPATVTSTPVATVTTATATTASQPPAPQPTATQPTATQPTATTATETTASATTATTDTTTTTTASTETTSTAPTPAPGSSSKSVILPIILIVIGVGVLIVLFRASS